MVGAEDTTVVRERGGFQFLRLLTGVLGDQVLNEVDGARESERMIFAEDVAKRAERLPLSLRAASVSFSEARSLARLIAQVSEK